MRHVARMMFTFSSIFCLYASELVPVVPDKYWSPDIEHVLCRRSITAKNNFSATPTTGVLLATNRRSRSRLISSWGDKTYLLQHFLYLLLPQSVSAAWPGKLHQPLVGFHVINAYSIRDCPRANPAHSTGVEVTVWKCTLLWQVVLNLTYKCLLSQWVKLHDDAFMTDACDSRMNLGIFYGEKVECHWLNQSPNHNRTSFCLNIYSAALAEHFQERCKPTETLNPYTLDLPTSTNSRHESPGLGSVLLQHAPFLRMYADYVRNFEQAMELVRTWTERSSAFRSIIQDIQVQDSLSRVQINTVQLKVWRFEQDLLYVLSHF